MELFRRLTKRRYRRLAATYVLDGSELTDTRHVPACLTDQHTERRVATADEWCKEMTPVNFKRLEAINTAREARTAVCLEGLQRAHHPQSADHRAGT
ncbi:hypothetical protein AB0D09_19600 [Streptomyces sp. NPDC049097]|uniref:hypothetical protein n=1 Tax=unclassified Streptomyces TaxID=2593676 RepID=UPI0034408EA2